jgi:hypothetical protein
MCKNGWTVPSKLVVRLKKDGGFPCIKEYLPPAADVEDFLSCVKVYNIFYKDGKESIDLEQL